MPTSATGIDAGRRRRPRREGAFTLVELLVVVAIAGILVAVAAINLFPDERQQARRAAHDVGLALEHARDEAWFGGLPRAITFEDGFVREWRLAGTSWEPDPAQQHAMAPGARVVAMHLEGQPLPAGSRLVFLSDGLGAPFRIALDVRGAAWAIESDAAGAVRVIEP